MVAVETLRETDGFLDRDPNFRNVSGHVHENRNQKERAQNPPQQSKARQGKVSAKNSSRKNTSRGGIEVDRAIANLMMTRREAKVMGMPRRMEQSLLPESGRWSRRSRYKATFSVRNMWCLIRSMATGPSIARKLYVVPYGMSDMDINNNGRYNDYSGFTQQNPYFPASSKDRPAYSQAVASNIYSNSSYETHVPPTQEYGSEYGSPASSQAPASGTSQHETTIRSKNIQEPRKLFSQDSAGVLQMQVESRNSPEQLAEEQRELVKRIPEALTETKKNEELQEIWEGMRSALVSNKRQRDRYRVGAPGKHRIDNRDEYELHQEKWGGPVRAGEVYRIWNAHSAKPRPEIVKTDELLKAGWHRESDHYYWWRYQAGPPNSAKSPRSTEREDIGIYKLQIDGTLVGTWNPSKDDSRDKLDLSI